MNTTLLCVALALTAPAPKEAPKKDMPTLTGKWVGIAEEGTGLAAQDLGKLSMEFNDGGLNIYDPSIKRPLQLTYTLNTTEKIATIDLRLEEPGGPAIVLQGIYRITDDKLELCFNKGGKGDRPTEFKGDAAKGLSFITLKRVPAEKKP